MATSRHNSDLSTLVLAVSLGWLWGASPATAQEGEASNVDRRRGMSFRYTAPSSDQLDAIATLESSLGVSLIASFNPTTGVTRTLTNPTGRLTPPQTGDPEDIAVEFVRSHIGHLGLQASDLDELEVCDRVYSRLTGTTHIYLCQSYYEIQIFNAQLQIHVSRDGSISGVTNTFVPRLAGTNKARERALSPEENTVVGIDEDGTVSPAIDARNAVSAAINHLGVRSRGRPRVTSGPTSATRKTTLLTDASKEPIEAKLAWLPVGPGLQLIWRLTLHAPDSPHVYEFGVEATGGLDLEDATRVMTRFNLTSDANSYLVYSLPTESPNHTSPLPPGDGRTLASGVADPIASPLGWHDTGAAQFHTMRGNNVHAYDDANDDNAPPSTEPICPDGDCSFPLNLSGDPTTYTDASIANVFYWSNLIHDVQYQYGFDEAAGNFQVNNFARGGIGNDDLRAEVQDGGGLNNANFLTLADGTRPRMQMFLWNQTLPRADGSLDAGIIIHEYGHGISTRQVGGPSNVFCLFNDQQPGEGLSDWWALAYTAKQGDFGDMRRGIATYVLGHPTDGDGIRTQPYSTDPTVNTHTYESINGMAVPHGVGEVWGQVAWEAYWKLVELHGFDPDLMNANGGAGNQRMMLYVNQGLKYTACSPTFTDVRDGIIQAASNLHNGEDVCTLWQSFADFGLGVNAMSGGSNSTTPTNGFKIPANCLPGPLMLSPEPRSVLDGPDASFQWESNGVEVTDYELWIGTVEGGNDLYTSGSLGTTQSVDVSGLPENGSTLYVRLRYRVDGLWGFKDFLYAAAASAPALLLPVPGSELPGTEATFEWASNGTAVTNYWLFVGTTLGGSDIHDSGILSSDVTSSTAQNLPTDGSPVHVRFWWAVGGLWNHTDYTYVAEDLPDPAIVDPVPGSQLSGTDVTFTWSDDGASVSLWELLIGSSAGGQEFFNSGPTTLISANVTGLPRDGSTIYVRLRFRIDGSWAFNDFQYTADVGRPKLTAPAGGSVLPGATVTFEWTADGTAVNAWWLYVGTTLGARDIHDSGNLGGALSQVVAGIPTDGRDIHVRLWHRIGLLWTPTDYLFTASSDGGTTPTPAITSPAPGSTLSGPNVTFTWSDNGTPVTSWWLYFGTSPGSNDLYDSGNLGLLTSLEVSGLPTDGNAIHVRLWYQTGGLWQSSLFEYGTEALTPKIVSPEPNTTLSNETTFVWEENPDGAPVLDWWLNVGTYLGGSDVLSSGTLGSAARSLHVTDIPTDGRTVFVRLLYRMSFSWSSADFVYNAASSGGPTMTSPEPGSVLPGSTVNFQWAPDPNGQAPMAWWLQVGSSPGGKDYLDSGSLGTSQSLSVSGLPVDGSAVYVRLWYFTVKWEFADFVFTAHQ